MAQYQNKRAKPGMSFPNNRSQPRGQNIPGPGKYQVGSLSPNRGKVPIGKSPRDPLSKRRSPGPGDYSSHDPTAKRSTGVIMSQSSRDLPDKNRVPGPGSYNSAFDALSRQRNGFSFTSQLRDTLPLRRNPGPGDYTPIGQILGKRGFSIGRSPKPVSYGISQGNMTQSAKILRKGAVSSLATLQTPGPGAYLIADDRTRARNKFSMPSQKRWTTDELTPGPGDYQIAQYKQGIRSLKSQTIGRSAKLLGNKELESVPGPGNYFIQSVGQRSMPKISFSKSHRDIDFEELGDISLKASKKGNGFSVTNKSIE